MATPDQTTSAAPAPAPAPAPETKDAPQSSNPFLSADDVYDHANHLVVDTSPFLRGGANKLRILGNSFYTIPEVLNEIRDRQARQDLAMLPFDITVINPNEASVRAVAAFARKTGDYAVLSATDLRVLALTYQIEMEKCGAKRIRTEPVRPNVQSGGTKAQAQSKSGRKKKNAAMEVTGDFEGETTESAANTEAAGADQTGTTVLEEGSDSEDDDEEEEVQEQAVEAVTESLEKLSTTEQQQPAPEKSAGASSSTKNMAQEPEQSGEKAEGEEGEGDDSDGEWITPENVKKFKRHGTLKPKKKRQAMKMQVACMTADFAMQNVLLQMGLNLLSADGLRISKIKSWVLRCHACTKVTSDMDKQFCPNCGNATLMRTSTSTDQNGNVRYYLKKNMVYNLRGTKYSIPAPKGGRRNNDLILREDQREYELAKNYQRRQKKVDAFDPDYVPRLLEGQIDTRNPFGAPIIGYGKRNPNAVKKNQTLRRRR
ncbi:Nin1 binding protein [Lunasporangiospora selenospora]|uniref:20S-pre-rRNA D-site endonuclease NOB1 n=1 Tax=Lunasporangiospora selenospora TaxID=979761 RepID=A0A9P6FNX0_9FUNG|nr:Nin1 binding protein [Lunasporangiospora selenospora]